MPQASEQDQADPAKDGDAETPPETVAPLQFGKYRLLRLLARGGMGEVFLARLHGELGFEKELVIKTILPELAAQPRFIELFAAEAKTAVALSHGNIVPTYELGRHGDTFYIAMGYVDGPSVSQLLRALRREDRDPELGAAMYIIRGVLTGLAYAHRDEPGRRAVVHRDISPRNILLDRSGQVRIVDFGIAARHKEEVELRAGSKGYMAPEQARAEAADPRADVFSTACLLYELVTHQKAFPKDGVWTAPPLHAVPEVLKAPLEAALALDPDIRPANASEFLLALRPAIAEHAATFSDPDLANLLGELFEQGWISTEPAQAGKTNIADAGAENKTFATRLTAVTGIHRESAAAVSAERSGTGPAMTRPDGSMTGLRADASQSLSASAAPPRRRIGATVAWVAAGGAVVFVLTRMTAADPPMSTPPSDPATPAAGLTDTKAEPPLTTADRAGPTKAGPSVATSTTPPTTPPTTVVHRVDVVPADARVFLDGTPLPGPSPYGITLPESGEAVLTVMKSGFVQQKLTLTKDSTLPDAIELRPEPPRGTGFLEVQAPSVPWAEVLVDGKKVGSTPTRPIKLTAGRHRLEVRCIPDACPSERVLTKRSVQITADQTEVVKAR